MAAVALMLALLAVWAWPWARSADDRLRALWPMRRTGDRHPPKRVPVEWLGPLAPAPDDASDDRHAGRGGRRRRLGDPASGSTTFRVWRRGTRASPQPRSRGGDLGAYAPEGETRPTGAESRQSRASQGRASWSRASRGGHSTRCRDRGRIPAARVCVAASVAVVTFLVVGDIEGVVLGAVLAGAVIAVASRREPTEARRRRERMAADLPFAADLMAACLRAGQPLVRAVETAATAVGGPLGARLASVGAQVRLGAAQETAWSELEEDIVLAPLARTMIRAVQSGAPVGDVLTRLADDARLAARTTSSAAARRVGVQAVAPLGLCFLPAFVFLGIIPVVAGLAAQVLAP
jgi:Flp pilus assembly protein TadB